MPSRPARKPSRLRRLARICLLALAVALALTVLPTLLWRWVPPPVSALMLQRMVAARWEGQRDYKLRYQWVPMKNISPLAALAVVAAEDQKFPDHFGFDFDSINRALRNNPHRTQPRGASTITQQVAKNLFLWPGRSYLRKGLEAGWTVLLEGLWPKERILEMYLNIAEFGPGIFGIRAASEVFFHKSPARLTQAEAATLAAVLPNPLRMDASRPSPYVRERAQDIQRQMANLGGPAYLRPCLP
ncbi:MAG: monofunctional biosynthetic peptidoglycan transglycosylase [Deltaproteobacteria bacterium RIFOXYD12_FULL_57_12]|nr:MAG: monofunctional biosynthetic peptidoglycan transglycosylase [Deltaproteobacteria bacterium RIFOXYD12_FULL_57_12]